MWLMTLDSDEALGIKIWTRMLAVEFLDLIFLLMRVTKYTSSFQYIFLNGGFS